MIPTRSSPLRVLAAVAVSESVADLFLLAGTASEVQDRIGKLGELSVNRIFNVMPGGVDGVPLCGRFPLTSFRTSQSRPRVA